MTAITVEDLKTAVEAAMAAKSGGVKTDRDRRLDERHFRRVDKYSGGAGWKEFAFQIRTSAGAADSRVRDVMDEIVKAGKTPDWDIIFATWSDEDMNKMGAELYAVLSTLVMGEAMTVVRGVPSGDGWEAWSRLFNRFDPRTPAKALMAMMAVMQPKKVKDVRELPSAVQEWEMKVKNLHTEHGIVLDAKIKVALMTSFLPADLQDYVFQWTDGKSSFEEMKDRIMALAVNRASLGRPTPMEVDGVQAWGWHEDHYGCEGQDWTKDWTEEGEEEIEIGYVGESCRRCGGMGHCKRMSDAKRKGQGRGGTRGMEGQGEGQVRWGRGEPSWKGSGWKGGEPGWKGGGKGGWKGKGKGFMGECWTCGERGHRSNECTNQNPKTAMEIGSVEEEQLHVGGVWAIAQVQAQEEEWSVAQSKKNRRKAQVNCRGCRGEHEGRGERPEGQGREERVRGVGGDPMAAGRIRRDHRGQCRRGVGVPEGVGRSIPDEEAFEMAPIRQRQRGPDGPLRREDGDVPGRGA